MCSPLYSRCASLLTLLIFPFCLNGQKLDSTGVWDQLNASLGVVYANPDSAMTMVVEAMSSAKELREPVLIARSHNFMGIVYDVKGMRQEALDEYGLAKVQADSLGEDRLYASALNNIGLIQWQQGDYIGALTNFQASLVLFKELGVGVGVANTLNNMGLIYTEQKRLDEALEFFREAQDAYRGLEDDYGRSAAYMNISRIYEEKNTLDSAIKYINLTLDLKQKINDPRGVAMCYANIGIIQDKLGNIDSSITCYERSIEIDRENGFLSYLSQHLSALGFRYSKAGRIEDAERVYLEGLELAESQDELKTLWGIHARLSELYTEPGIRDYQKAHYHSNQYATLYIEWRDAEREEEVINLEERFDVARKEAMLAEEREARALDQLKVQSRDKWIAILAAAAILLVILIIIIINRLEKRRARLAEEHALREELKASEHEAELNEQREGISRDLHDSIGSQLTFLSSTLKNLTWALKNQSRPTDDTLKRLEDVSAYAQKTVSDLRDTVWAMNRDDLTHGEIMLRLENSVKQWSEAFKGLRIATEMQGDDLERVSADKGMNIYRILQEALTNIRKHAKASEVKIKAEKSEGRWIWTISDDGVGFDVRSRSASNGLKNIQERAKQAGLTLQIKSALGEGTSILISENAEE